MVWGSLFLLSFSFTMHVVGPHDVIGPDPREHMWAVQLPDMLKHGAELAGWMVLATAMAAAAWSTYAALAARSSSVGMQT